MKAKGPLLLLITAVLWGMAFVAQTTAADAVGPFTFNASRNVVGAVFLSGVIAWRKRSGQDKPPVVACQPTSWSTATGQSTHGRPTGSPAASQHVVQPVTQSAAQTASSQSAGRLAASQSAAAQRAAQLTAQPATPSGYTKRTLLVAGFLCGIALCIASFLQQAGITAYPPEAATSSRSGFVTATYMVMVAVLGVFLGKRLHPLVIAAVAIALLGMYLLCVPDGLQNVYLGDWLVLGSALGYAIHILIIDCYTAVDGVRLSRVQLLTAGGISIVCAFLFEQPDPAAILVALVPILYAGICSDGIAYTLQIIGQQSTDPTVASIIMSLESVFAAIGGWIILSESLSAVELLGCLLVFAAVLFAQVPDFTRKKEA